MNKLFLLLALMGLVAIGCSQDEIIFFALDKESVTISPDGGSVDVVVYSNYKWEISGTSDWCTPSITKGDANEDGQKVTFSADVAYDDREATFWFRCADEKIKFVVSQKFKEVIIPDANNSFNIPAEGGFAVISYKTTVDCEIVIPEEAQDWISVAPATRGLVAFDTTLKIAANNSGKERRSVVKVVSRENNSLFAEYTISQDLRYCLCYTSIDGEIVTPYSSSAFDAVILSNTYKDGVGVIEFNAPITTVGDYAFKGCSSLTSVTIPNSVTAIGWDAFEACSSLTSVTIPDSVTSIGGGAFVNCSNLASVTIPDRVTMIEWGTFLDCYSLTNVTIPDSVTAIGERAFAYCSSLKSVIIGDSVTSIGEYAFEDCSSLTNVTIGDSVTTIGEYAFEDCSRLTNVYINDIAAWCNISFSTMECHPLRYAGDGNLYLNNELVTDLTIPDTVTAIGEYAFYNCSGLTSVTIPDSVTTVGMWAFYQCGSLTSVAIGDNVTTIGDIAFGLCGLTSVTIPDSVTTIGVQAFFFCFNLTSVTIGEGVSTIGAGAFESCRDLTSVYCKQTTPPAGGIDMFNNNASECKIYVPMGSVSEYKSASYWSDYADVIVGYEF